MTTLPVPKGRLAVVSDIRENDAGRRGASAAVMRMPFGRALQSDHAAAFDANVAGVPTDSAADVPVGACTRANVRRVAAPARH
jgi:hypothetical protein